MPIQASQHSTPAVPQILILGTEPHSTWSTAKHTLPHQDSIHYYLPELSSTCHSKHNPSKCPSSPASQSPSQSPSTRSPSPASAASLVLSAAIPHPRQPTQPTAAAPPTRPSTPRAPARPPSTRARRSAPRAATACSTASASAATRSWTPASSRPESA